MQAMTRLFNRSFFRAFALAALLSVAMAGCGGGGDGGGGSSNPPPAGSVTVTGRVEFERPQFKAVANQGLNLAAPTVMPARQVVVEAIDPTSRARIGVATSTDDSGNYSLNVPANTNV